MQLQLVLREDLSLKMKLELAVRLSKINSQGICPKCSRRHSDKEIRQGWTNNPYDFTTKCLKCNIRFVALLSVKANKIVSSGTFAYLCKTQLFTALHDALKKHKRKYLGFQFLLKKYPDLFWNMIRHYGNYEIAQAEFRKWH